MAVESSTDKKRYVYRLMKVSCSCSAKEFKQKLNLPIDHGVVFHDSETPLLNANDHVAEQHIGTFGRCKSPTNPGDPLARILSGGVGMVLDAIGGCECVPMTLVPWLLGDEAYCIDGAPALTIESELPCFYGGTIKIVLEKESDDDSSDTEEEQETEEETDIKDQLPSEVQEKIDSFCDDEAGNPQSAADAVLAEEEAARQQEREEALARLGGNLFAIDPEAELEINTDCITQFDNSLFQLSGEKIEKANSDNELWNSPFTSLLEEQKQP